MKYKPSGRTIPTPPAKQDPVRSPPCLDPGAKDSYLIDIDIEQPLDPPSENSACFSRSDPGAAPGESSVGPVAPMFLDVLAAVDKSQNEDLRLVDEHLNPCQPYATCPDQVIDAVSREFVMDVQMVVLQPDDEAEKSFFFILATNLAYQRVDRHSLFFSLKIENGAQSTQPQPLFRLSLLSKEPLEFLEAKKSPVSDRDVLGNPMHASALVEVVHEIRSSSAVLSINGVGFCDLTPNSITKFSCKYFQDASWALAAELQCCKNDGTNYVSQGVSLDGIHVGWLPDQTLPQKSNNKVSIRPIVSTMVEEDPANISNPIPVALQMVLEANATQAYLASLTPEELQTISGLLDEYLSAESEAPSTSSPRVVAD
ncbi:hypothetical protein Nepgr_017351 [Nepenthes gracilis]|uniref:Uncharacterized protein n=1 Tax=Nepenthes gracilis TaxID=150966 RepID=A0AAD3XTA9_NEPGR|nr:hypothetical protein Nepgr_017351 [Nepenthes gracilis]